MDVLSKLQECSIRGVSFPVVTIDESFDHDLPQHKGVDRDGAFIENTGRNPYTFQLVAPFYAAFSRRNVKNGPYVKVDALSPGKNEKWSDLYPGRFELVRNACIDRTTCDFVHPLYGTFKVKVSSWSSSLNADERGGQTATISVIETRDDGEQPSFTESNISLTKSTAISLDSAFGQLVPSPLARSTNIIDNFTTFENAVNDVIGKVDGATLHAQQKIAKIDRLVTKLESVRSSVDRSASVVIDDGRGTKKNLGRLAAGSARIRTDCTVLISALRDVRQTLAVDGNRTLETYIVPRPTMLITLAMRLKTSSAELMALNPTIPTKRPTIPANTLVRYYAAR